MSSTVAEHTLTHYLRDLRTTDSSCANIMCKHLKENKCTVHYIPPHKTVLTVSNSIYKRGKIHMGVPVKTGDM